MRHEEEVKALIEMCENIDFAATLACIADKMRYDTDLQAVVIPIENVPDETFPDDEHLQSGPLAMTLWKLALSDLADALPPWS